MKLLPKVQRLSSSKACVQQTWAKYGSATTFYYFTTTWCATFLHVSAETYGSEEGMRYP